MEIPKAIISDADGTLVDTVHLIRHGQYETAKLYLERYGIESNELPTYEVYERHLNEAVGGSARDTLERTMRQLYAHQPHHLEAMDFDELHELLNPVQDEIAPKFVKAYDGLSEFLSKLGRLQIKLAIFTSGAPHHVVRNFGVALPELGLIDLFRDASMADTDKLRLFENTLHEYYKIPAFTVVTCDDVTTHKPDPASLNLAMERLDVGADETMVLGDHPVDMQAGRNAGINNRTGISHGFTDRAALLQGGATRVVDSLSEVV